MSPIPVTPVIKEKITSGTTSIFIAFRNAVPIRPKNPSTTLSLIHSLPTRLKMHPSVSPASMPMATFVVSESLRRARFSTCLDITEVFLNYARVWRRNLTISGHLPAVRLCLDVDSHGGRGNTYLGQRSSWIGFIGPRPPRAMGCRWILVDPPASRHMGKPARTHRRAHVAASQCP